MKNKLKSYVRYDGDGKIVPFSVRWAKKAPKNGDWVEVNSDLCCGTTTSTTTIFEGRD